ncbi:GNAT family N-acetyltransferase [candidate division KSB1 bacterium]|nr:GNAT family N-acetyltransferase [candidate division KSB1 bacterium]
MKAETPPNPPVNGGEPDSPRHPSAGARNPEFEIIPLADEHRAWAREVCEQWWGGVEIMSRFVWFDTTKLAGFVAVTPPAPPNQRFGGEKTSDLPPKFPNLGGTEGGLPIGLATYHIADGECELISLNSFAENRGVGAALLAAVRAVAKRASCNRMFLTTSNDNLRALQFYQKRGMRIVAVHVGAIDAARVTKPRIPEIGDHGIPCRDELELEEKLES